MPHQTLLSEEAAAWSAPCQLPQALRTTPPPHPHPHPFHPLSKDHGSFQWICGTVQREKTNNVGDVFAYNFFRFTFSCAIVLHYNLSSTGSTLKHQALLMSGNTSRLKGPLDLHISINSFISLPCSMNVKQNFVIKLFSLVVPLLPARCICLCFNLGAGTHYNCSKLL